MSMNINFFKHLSQLARIPLVLQHIYNIVNTVV